jgi:hypothetical protein
MESLKGNPVAHLTKYELHHLTAHLQASGRIGDLHRLLALETSEHHNAWFEAKEAFDDTAAYLRDVNRAWVLAESRADEVGTHCRYALLVASITNLASNILPELQTALVAKGIWTPLQGIAYAQRALYQQQRTEGVLELTPYLSASVLLEILVKIQNLSEDEQQRLETLLRLAPHLSDVLLRAMLQTIARWFKRENTNSGSSSTIEELQARQIWLERMDAARRTLDAGSAPIESLAAGAIVELQSELPASLLSEAVEVALACGEDGKAALPDLVSRLVEVGQIQEALVIVRRLPRDKWRVQALERIASHLLEQSYRDELLALAQEFPLWEVEWRARMLEYVLPYLQEPQRTSLIEQELTHAQGESFKLTRVRALAWLLPHLPEMMRSVVTAEALADAKSIENQLWRAEALAAIAPHLSESGRYAILTEALEAVQASEPESYWSQALEKLAPHLSGPLLYKAMAIAQNAKDEQARIRAVKALIPYLPSLLLQEVLAIIPTMVGGTDQWSMMEELAPYLPEPLLCESLALVRSIEKGLSQAYSLAVLIPHLPDSLLEQALTAAQLIEDKNWFPPLLARLAPRLSEALLNKALAVVQLTEVEDKQVSITASIKNEDTQASIMAALAPHLSADLLRRSMDAAITHRGVFRSPKEKVLAVLIPYLAKQGFPQEAINAARKLRSSRSNQCEALIEMAPYLPESLLREALDMARGIDNEYDRRRALAGLAPHLPASLLREDLALARRIDDSSSQSAPLRELSQWLIFLDDVEGALAAVEAIVDVEAHLSALVELLPKVPETVRPRLLFRVVEMTQQVRSEQARVKTLIDILPFLTEIERTEVLSEAMVVAREIRDVSDRVRTLMIIDPHLPPEEREALHVEALAEVRKTELDEPDAQHIAKLLSPLPGETQPSIAGLVFADIRTSGVRESRKRALIELFPHLSEIERAATRAEVLVTVRESGTVWDRVRNLIRLTPYFPEPERTILIDEALTLTLGNTSYLTNTLPEVAPLLSEQLLREAIIRIEASEDEDWRQWALAILAPYLAKFGYVDEALKLLSTFEGRFRELYKDKALVGISPYLSEQLLREVIATAQVICKEAADERELLLQERFAQRDRDREYERGRALSHLVCQLANLGYAEEALTAAQTMKENSDSSWWPRTIAALALHIPKERRAEVFAEGFVAARNIEDIDKRAKALKSLASTSLHLYQSEDLPFANFYPLWCEALHVLASRTRKDLLSDIAALADGFTLLDILLDQTAVLAETAQAIVDVGRWFP